MRYNDNDNTTNFQTKFKTVLLFNEKRNDLNNDLN